MKEAANRRMDEAARPEIESSENRRINTRYAVIPRTLCFVLNGDDVLVIKRSPHKRLFPNKINGVGGHVERDEDVRAAAAREIDEESGLIVDDLWLAGVVNVDGGLGQADPLVTGGVPGVMLFIFTAQASSRTLRPSGEGELYWVPLDAVHDLDWVDGDPGLLLQALAARQAHQPFFAYKAA